MKLTTTFNLIKKTVDVYDEQMLRNIFGKNCDPDKPINLLTILTSFNMLESGQEHFFWSFCAVQQDWGDVKPILINIVTDIAESVLHIFEEEYPNDHRPRKAIEICRREYTNLQEFIGTVIKLDLLEGALNAAGENLINAPKKLEKIAKSAHAAATALQAVMQLKMAFRKRNLMEKIMMEAENSILRIGLGLERKELDFEKIDLNDLKSAICAVVGTAEMAKYAGGFQEQQNQIEIIKKYLTWE